MWIRAKNSVVAIDTLIMVWNNSEFEGELLCN